MLGDGPSTSFISPFSNRKYKKSSNYEYFAAHLSSRVFSIIANDCLLSVINKYNPFIITIVIKFLVHSFWFLVKTQQQSLVDSIVQVIGRWYLVKKDVGNK